jgi:hypothetical protein
VPQTIFSVPMPDHGNRAPTAPYNVRAPSGRAKGRDGCRFTSSAVSRSKIFLTFFFDDDNGTSTLRAY